MLSQVHLTECLVALRARTHHLKEQAGFLGSIGVTEGESRRRFPVLWAEIDRNHETVSAVALAMSTSFVAERQAI